MVVLNSFEWRCAAEDAFRRDCEAEDAAERAAQDMAKIIAAGDALMAEVQIDADSFDEGVDFT